MQIVGTATEETWTGVTRLPEYNTGKCVNYCDVIAESGAVSETRGQSVGGVKSSCHRRQVISPLKVNLDCRENVTGVL